jgi:L-alanine-DL-glutamate epimerase-like enolase superfamily enzyme
MWVDLDQPIFGGIELPDQHGRIGIPTAPGLGADPDPTVVQRYRVA